MIIAFLALLGALLQPGTPALAIAPTQGETFMSEEQGIEALEKNRRVSRVMQGVTMTAYSSTPDQTDDSPFTMANGKRVHDGAVAANFLPFGTKVMFPELYGDKVFTVEDRMHKRFSNRMDIWMETRGEAIKFGIREVTVEILEDAV
ncbi:MAG: 3D domain-containing protein [Candidatus Azambacteria bacterium]|nr:3D domain-containing protein [Candidatus Azambacteria bacterium]